VRNGSCPHLSVEEERTSWNVLLVADGDVESETVFSPLTDGDVVLPSHDAEGIFELLAKISKSIRSSLGFEVLQHHIRVTRQGQYYYILNSINMHMYRQWIPIFHQYIAIRQKEVYSNYQSYVYLTILRGPSLTGVRRCTVKHNTTYILTNPQTFH